MSRHDKIWQEKEVAERFLGVRTAFPYALDHPVILRDILRTGRPIKRFMDIGCGAGFFTDAVHAAWPNALAIMVDFSEAMLEQAAANTTGPHEIHTSDLLDSSWSESLPPVDAVVSGFAIHHLPDTHKRRVYADIHALLKPGGWYVHVEHVASESQVGIELFDQQIATALLAHFRKTHPDMTMEESRNFWDDRCDDHANILTSVWTQCDWLRELGFEDVDCFFKSYEVAIFGGRAPAAKKEKWTNE